MVPAGRPAEIPLIRPTVGISVLGTITNRYSCDIELWYRQKGCAYRYASDTLNSPPDNTNLIPASKDLTLHYLSVPIKFIYSGNGYRMLFPYLYSGVYGGMLLNALDRHFHSEVTNRYGATHREITSSEINLLDRINWYDAGILFGGGVEVGLGVRGILLDGGIEIGLTDIIQSSYENQGALKPMQNATIHMNLTYEIRIADL